MKEIERGRVVGDVVEDGAGQCFPEGDGPVELGPRSRLGQETLAEPRDVGDAIEVKAEVKGERPLIGHWRGHSIGLPWDCQTLGRGQTILTGLDNPPAPEEDVGYEGRSSP